MHYYQIANQLLKICVGKNNVQYLGGMSGHPCQQQRKKDLGHNKSHPADWVN